MLTAPGSSIPDKTRPRSCHRRTDSGELDVFEAEHYFSAAAENLSYTTTTTRELECYNYTTNSQQLGNWRQGRASLDMPGITRHNIHHILPKPQDIVLDHTIKLPSKENKKHKQPNSPGEKLANFFNSLINQNFYKKKKPSKSSSQPLAKDIVEVDSPGGWRRRRRSSISHFTTTTAMSDIDDAKSIQSCSSLVSGFRTPPPYMINKPIKAHKEFKSAFNSSASSPKPTWLDDKLKFLNGLSSEKNFLSKDATLEKRVNRIPEAEVKSTDFKRFMEEDGGESDSSSDLFELQLNYDYPHHGRHQLGYCASDLPVYETTHMDTSKISSGNPIASGPFRN